MAKNPESLSHLGLNQYQVVKDGWRDRITIASTCLGLYNNNNNNRIYIAQVCRMTSEALDGQLQSCYTARARPKCLTEEKCF